MNQSASDPFEACRLEERGEEREFGVRLCEARRQGVGEERLVDSVFSGGRLCPAKRVVGRVENLADMNNFFSLDSASVFDVGSKRAQQPAQSPGEYRAQRPTHKTLWPKTTTPRMHWFEPTRPGCRLERREV